MRVLAALLSLLAGAPASAETLRSAAELAGIHVGAAIGVEDLADSGALVAREFTSVTTENALKWGELARQSQRYSFAEAEAVVAFAERHDLRVRGHTLIWSRLNGLPSWLTRRATTEAAAGELRRLTEAHIRFVVGRYRGRIAQWDVVNEPLVEGGTGLDPRNPILALLGEDFLGEAFAIAHSADPEAELFLNEIFTEDDDARFDALVALARRLVAAGAPIDGIGLQGHFLRAPPDPGKLRDRMQTIGALGLSVEITELDIPIGLFDAEHAPLAAQARAYAGVVGACLDVPACTGVTIWGVGDGESWLGAEARALLFDAELAPKPAYHAVLERLEAAAR